MPHVENVPIILKRSSVPGKIPQDSDLVYGELALNYADGVLRFKTADNEVAAFPQAKKVLTPAWASTLTIDLLNGRVDVVRLSVDGNVDITLSNAKDGQRFILELIQGTGGNYTYTITNDIRMTTAISRSYAPSITAGLLDQLGFIYRVDKFYLVATAFGFSTT